MRIRTHTNPLSYIQRFEKIQSYADITQYTGVDFEIGFGQESFILDYAKQYKSRLIVGAEVRKKAVTLMQEKITNQNIKNIIAIHGNGHICLEDLFNNHSLDNIFIFHPDPWMKQRHHNRRVINETFLMLAQQKLKLSGKLHISTDVQELWQYIFKQILNTNRFILSKNEIFWQECYSTPWTSMCLDRQRTIFYGTFEPK